MNGYWDTSYLIKLYAPETDSALVKAQLIEGTQVVTSEITRFEMHAALQRKESLNDLCPGGASRALEAYDGDVLAGLITVKPMDLVTVRRFEAVIEQCYHQSPVIPLRTLDAIHLAAATSMGQSEMITTDKRLRDAAISIGLAVFPTK